MKPKGLLCEPARSTCEKDALCSGESGVCPEHGVVPNDTPCDAHNACIEAGGTCFAAACTGGRKLIGFDVTEASAAMRWEDDAPPTWEDATVVVRHAGGPAAIELTGASVEPPGVFKLVSPASWPVWLRDGDTASVVVGVAEMRVGTYQGVLTIKATGCDDTDLQLPLSGTVEGHVSKRSGCGSAGGAGSLLLLAVHEVLRRRRRKGPPGSKVDAMRRG